MKTFLSLAGLCALGLVLMPGVDATDKDDDDEDGGRRFAITITNLTHRQVFTPIVAASHMEGVRLFTLGQPASVPLEILAEAGDTGALKTMLMANPAVKSVVDSGAVLPPGESVTLFVERQGGFDHVSLASMLVPTNDGFFALNGVEGPKGKKIMTMFSPAYDAGTEANNELCASIPGPPAVCAGEGFNAGRPVEEGYVHIHRGIHGIGNLVAATYDWRNPVAHITIRQTN